MARKNRESNDMGATATMDAETTSTANGGESAQGAATAGNGDKPQAPAGRTLYKLNGKDVPVALVGKAVTFPEAASLAALREQCAGDSDSDRDEHIKRAAQGAIDIVRQGRARALSGSDEVAAIIGGTAEGTADLSEEERLARAVAYIQEELDEWRYGSVVRGTGASAAVKAEAEQARKIKEAAAADPELAAKLAAMGIVLAPAAK